MIMALSIEDKRERIASIINSCSTLEQLESATNLLDIHNLQEDKVLAAVVDTKREIIKGI
tara:strand:- start:1038 stop:1217 length:180 start_codon:yes stop_codon:yes gene_type:complete